MVRCKTDSRTDAALITSALNHSDDSKAAAFPAGTDTVPRHAHNFTSDRLYAKLFSLDGTAPAAPMRRRALDPAAAAPESGADPRHMLIR